LGNRKLNKADRLICKNLELYDFWFRYKDLVANPERIMAEISTVLGRRVEVKTSWSPEHVQPDMIKLERHRLLQEGRITTGRVGLWKASAKTLSGRCHKTASLMGY
jgi:hypothetical protein